MSKSTILAGVAAAALIVGAPPAVLPPAADLGVVSQAQAQARFQVSVGVFYDRLAAHVWWVRHPVCGYVWVPNVPRGWLPYTHGQWVYTSPHGWMWVSDEPFGWATYHYGRWVYRIKRGR
jgi:hypothetical protein